MEPLHFSTIINAPRQKVWDIMLTKDTYLQWIEPFNPGNESYYEGDWAQGNDIRFVGLDQDGNKGGMISKIAENREPEFLSIHHVGEFNKDGERLYEPGQDFFENYTLNEKDGGTELLIDLDIPEEYKGFMSDLWPKALAKLKEMCEK